MSDYDQETGEVIDQPGVPALQPRMQPLASPETREVCTALAIAQGQFEAPKRTKKADAGRYTYTYAPLEEVIRVIQKPMAENGLSRQQYLVSRHGQWFVRTIIWHISGQWISSDYPIFADDLTQQKFQSGVTYAKRQGLSLALGLAPEDDDDANVADGRPATVQGRTEAPRTQERPQGHLTTGNGVDATPEPPKAAALYNKLMRDMRDARSNEELDAVSSTARFQEVANALIAVERPEKAEELIGKLDATLVVRRSELNLRDDGGRYGLETS